MTLNHTTCESGTKVHLKESDFYKPYLKEPSDYTIQYYALQLLGKQSKFAENVAKKLFQSPIELGEKIHTYLNTTKKQSQLPPLVALG